MTTTEPVRVPTGRLLVTPGVLAALTPFEVNDCVRRHYRGDWGDVDAEDKRTNDLALTRGERLLSAYVVHNVRVWIITEHDRSVSTVLLPEEY